MQFVLFGLWLSTFGMFLLFQSNFHYKNFYSVAYYYQFHRSFVCILLILCYMEFYLLLFVQ